VPGYYIPPLRGWRWMVLDPPLSQKYGSHAVSGSAAPPKSNTEVVFQKNNTEVVFQKPSASELPG
jgi:hypothetical protein